MRSWFDKAYYQALDWSEDIVTLSRRVLARVDVVALFIIALIVVMLGITVRLLYVLSLDFEAREVAQQACIVECGPLAPELQGSRQNGFHCYCDARYVKP